MPYCTVTPADTPPFPFVMLHGITPEGQFTRGTSATSHTALVAALLDDPEYEHHDGPEQMKRRMHLATACAAAAALAGEALVISDVHGLNVLDIRSDATLIASLGQARIIVVRQQPRE